MNEQRPSNQWSTPWQASGLAVYDAKGTLVAHTGITGNRTMPGEQLERMATMIAEAVNACSATSNEPVTLRHIAAIANNTRFAAEDRIEIIQKLLAGAAVQPNEQAPSKKLSYSDAVRVVRGLPRYDDFARRYVADALIREVERLQTALRGIQSCSTCEACRGAATRALGGATPEPDPELQRRAEYADRFHEVCQLAVTHLGKFCPNDFRSARKGEFVAAVYAAAESALNGAGEIPPLLRATQPPGVDAEAIATKVVRSVCELPDYNSPADQPELLTCTASELHAAVVNALEGHAPPPGDDPFQDRVAKWMVTTFDAKTVTNKVERNHRFLEESLELVQSLGCTQVEAHMLVDYVFGRPVGECEQETGGVMVTLAALANASNIRVNRAAETELARCWTKIDVIRAKQAAKPKHSPLPGPSETKGAAP